MKVLYAIQCTGNGHLSRAIEIVPLLRKRVQVDILVSGIQGDIPLPFDADYNYHGLSFIFGKKGGINYWETLKRNNLFELINEIKQCPVTKYDLIINDFEPVSAWAARLKHVNCIGLSHQIALLSKKVPQTQKKSRVGRFVLKYYAPSLHHFGFHFQSYDSDIYLSVIRQRIRQTERNKKGYYVVYLPAYADEKIINALSSFKHVEWRVFSKHSQRAYITENFFVRPIEIKSFEKSLARCNGVICGAGFETPAEALFLNKKLMVVPMEGQFEQQMNAAALKNLGVRVLPFLDPTQTPQIKQWLENDTTVTVNYPDQTREIIDGVLSKYVVSTELTHPLIKSL